MDGRSRRLSLMPERRFLPRNRRVTEPLVGVVGRRGGGDGAIAWRSSWIKRDCAAWRLRHWERCSLTAITTAPSTSWPVNRCKARCRRGAGSEGVVARGNTNSTRESVVFTLCPPGPEEREKRHTSSLAGIATRADRRRVESRGIPSA